MRDGSWCENRMGNESLMRSGVRCLLPRELIVVLCRLNGMKWKMESIGMGGGLMIRSDDRFSFG